MAERIALQDLNALPDAGFVARLADIFEHSPWVPEAVLAKRPFPDIASLHAAMVAAVDAAGNDAALALLRAHPELARRATLTAASAAEQGGMGLDRLDQDEAARFEVSAFPSSLRCAASATGRPFWRRSSRAWNTMRLPSRRRHLPRSRRSRASASTT
jgi:hypothetical protein